MAPLTKRKKIMNDFSLPVGAIQETINKKVAELTATPFTSPSNDGKEYVEVIGRGGSVRHSGYFSPNNPYLANLQSANKNQDKDALYELAVKWEADNYNTQESRDYNSPLSQVGLSREAGINSDIVGSSAGSAGSSGSAGSAIPQQTSQTKFSNAYDNISSATAVVNSVVSTAQSITALVQTIGTMSDVFSLSHNAAARDRIMTENMPNILSKEGITQADTERRQAENVSSMYDAWGTVVSNFNFADESKPSDEEFETLFQSLGLYEEGQRMQFRNWLNSPNAIKQIKTAQFEKNKAKAQELAWNYEALLRQAQLDVAFQLSTLEAESAFAGIRSIFANILSENGQTLAQDGASSILNNTASDAITAEINRGVAQQELKRFKQFTQRQTELLKYLDDQLESLAKTGLPTNETRFLYNQVAIAKKQITDMGYSQYLEMFNLYNSVTRGIFSGLDYIGSNLKSDIDDPVTHANVKDFYNLVSGGNGQTGSINPFSMAFDLAKIVITKKLSVK